jgi:hypothetical protein
MNALNLLNVKEADRPMKLVYRLEEDLKKDKERVFLTQNLTLDKSRPFMGLKGTYGLFASREWWDSIREGKMPLMYYSGVILRAYVTGQDQRAVNNIIDLKIDDDSVRAVGIYVNNKADAKLFRVGYRASIVYALDELKKQPGPDGGVNYSKVALEMAVSLQPDG